MIEHDAMSTPSDEHSNTIINRLLSLLHVLYNKTSRGLITSYSTAYGRHYICFRHWIKLIISIHTDKYLYLGSSPVQKLWTSHYQRLCWDSPHFIAWWQFRQLIPNFLNNRLAQVGLKAAILEGNVSTAEVGVRQRCTSCSSQALPGDQRLLATLIIGEDHLMVSRPVGSISYQGTVARESTRSPSVVSTMLRNCHANHSGTCALARQPDDSIFPVMSVSQAC